MCACEALPSSNCKVPIFIQSTEDAEAKAAGRLDSLMIPSKILECLSSPKVSIELGWVAEDDNTEAFNGSASAGITRRTLKDEMKFENDT